MTVPCRCMGQFTMPTPCEYEATQEDGLCDGCRANGCEARREEVLTTLRTAAETNPQVAAVLGRMKARGDIA